MDIICLFKASPPLCLMFATGVQLHGFMVEDDTKRRKLFFCETERERDAWCWYFQNHATRKVNTLLFASAAALTISRARSAASRFLISTTQCLVTRQCLQVFVGDLYTVDWKNMLGRCSPTASRASHHC